MPRPKKTPTTATPTTRNVETNNTRKWSVRTGFYIGELESALNKLTEDGYMVYRILNPVEATDDRWAIIGYK